MFKNRFSILSILVISSLIAINIAKVEKRAKHYPEEERKAFSMLLFGVIAVNYDPPLKENELSLYSVSFS